ncbi:MAG: addiction module toxin, HicA family [Chlorobi bacterium]|nr:addiction module toxin, HicA family [Chlorobiota bacterium]
MSKLPSSKSIISVLLSNGFIFISQRGSHCKYRKDDKTVIVPSPRKEIPIGTFRSIVRQSGLSINDFNKIH